MLALLVCLVGCAAGGSPTSAGLMDLEGRPVDPLGHGRGAATVFLFTRSDCPISNRYAPEVQRLEERFTPRGATFYLVDPDPDEPVEAIRHHLREYGYDVPALRDPRHRLVAATGAEVTPEAAVFDAAGKMVYRGRIDDRWVGFGQARTEASRHDLEEVLEALTSGGTVEPHTTRAIGCFIEDLS